MPRKQIYFGFQYINELSVKFIQNISKLISKNLNYCILSVFRTLKKEEIYSRTSHQKLKDLTKIRLHEYIEFLVMTVLNATVYWRIKEH